MPITDNSDSTAGRVTRSLRKRLTSIDSETSSRPGTPVISNLLTIPETVTPSKRVTRRTSISAPLETPSKLKGRLENVNSPARRSTRRRSVSILEEDHVIPSKSKEPSILAVQEEVTIEKTPKVKNQRVTRSTSKSPLEPNLPEKKTTPKVDVIYLDDSDETSITSPASNNKKQTKVLIKKEKSIDEMASQASPVKELSKTSAQKKQREKVVDVNSTPFRGQKEKENLEDISKKSDDIESNTKLNTSQKDAKNKNGPSDVLFSPEMTPNSPQNKKNLNSLKIQPVEYSPQKNKSRPEKLKNVAFNETAEESAIKSVFPKTPGLTKSKSYILDSSKDVDKETSIVLTENPEESEKSDKEDFDEEDHDALNAKTPYKLKLKAVESSTPIQSASPKRNETTDVEKQTQESPNTSTKEKDSTPLFPKSWTQSVSGKVSDKVKIDSIESEEKLRKKLEEEEALKNAEVLSSRKQRTKKAISDSDDDDDDMLEEDVNDDYNDSLDEEEECDREKTVFIDDEAMEVPEGEESMDSEERAYLEENEVPVYGESIGSQDSEDGDFEEEADEEDDAFIVSDSEDVRGFIESDSDTETKKVGKEKKYKRIVKRMSESSNDEAGNKAQENNSTNAPEESGGNAKRNSLNEKGDESESDGLTKNIGKAGEEETISELENRPQSNKKERKSTKKNLSNRIVDEGDESDVEEKEEDELSLSKLRNILNKSNPDKDSKVDSPNRRMSQKRQQEEDVSKSKLIVDEIETVNDETENKKPSKKDRKSLNSSKHDKTVLEDDSDVEREPETKKQSKIPKESRKSRSKPDISESDDDSKSHPDETSASKYPKKTLECEEPLSPAKTSKRKSINQTAQEENIVNTPSPKREYRKSLKEDQNASKSCTSMNKSKQPESDEEEFVESATKEKNQSLKLARKSVGKTNPEEAVQSPRMKDLNASSKKESRKSLKDDQNTSQFAKSMNKSESDSDQDVFIEPITKDKNQSLNQGKNFTGNTNFDEAERSPKSQSLNVSRKSLTTDPANEEKDQQSLHSRSLNKSKLEKTVLSFEGGSEPEDTLSASEVPSRTSGGSLNSSKKSRKSSLNQSKISLPSDDESDVEEAESKKHHQQSVDQNMVLRVDSTPEVSASEEETEGDDEENERRFSDTDADGDQHKSQTGQNTMLEFLGEEYDTSQHPTSMNLNSTRRKSSVNKSKLDETFEMEIGNSISMRDSLHRSIMRKSLNQSQLHKQMVSQEEELADESDDSSTEEDVKANKKVLSKQGLSVSLSNIELKKKKLKGGEQNIHNSFTIGVSVRASPHPPFYKASPSESGTSNNDHVLSEQEDLEKIQHVERVGPNKSRNYMSTSLKVKSVDPDGIKQQKRIKRTSLYMQEDTASQSFVDNIAEEKKKVESKRKRKSNSFCGVVAPSEEHHEGDEPKDEEKPPLKSGDKTNIQRILSRCDEILEAANRAKRDAKLNAKKSKVKKPKWMDKQEKASQAEDEVQIPLVSKKELKRKEKIKKELAKAIKHSTAMLKTIDPKLGNEFKKIESEETNDNSTSSKRLPTEFLKTLEEVPQQKKKKSKEIVSTPPSDKENSKKRNNKDTYPDAIRDVSSEKKKKKRNREILETATGTVIVEPSTPVKLRCQNGFRESPKTPVGFKIQDIHASGQNKNTKSRKRAKTLFTASGKFVEEDMSKANTKIDNTRKRKRHIEEPSHSLPKTQWTPSGVFIEEDLYNARPLANSTSTQFMISSLNGNKKIKNPIQVMSSTTLDSALSFKQNALFGSKARRETSRALIHRKQRKNINNKF